MNKHHRIDADAFAKLIVPHQTKLTATAFAYTKNYTEAQDIVQQTLMKAFEAIHQLNEPAYFSTWLYKILIRQCFAHMKAKKRAQQVAFELQQLQLTEQEHAPDFEQLYNAMHQLKNHYQTVILLHYFYDFKLHEIASVLNKPLNTVKIQLHRARIQLKQQMQRTSTQKDVTAMLQQLKEKALHYVSIPPDYTLSIADINQDGATFLWREQQDDDGYYIHMSPTGELLSLSQPPEPSNVTVSDEKQRTIAEQFITAQYGEALHYFTLEHVKIQQASKRYYYKQFVHGVPLQSAYCTIEVATSGQIVSFEYKPYKTELPKVPATFAPTEPIREQLKQADWQIHLEYISSDDYTVEQSGLYVVYSSAILYHSFDAETGNDLSVYYDEDEEQANDEQFVPIRIVASDVPQETIEEIIGIPQSMVRIRQTNTEHDCVGIVWREKDYAQPNEASMQQFILDRFEHTVKATVHSETGELRSFVFFQERTGELSLSYAACEHIALTFLHTYFHSFIPHLKMHIHNPSLNEEERAFFHFGLFIDDMPIEGEFFRLCVNKTTGLIDSLIGPKIRAEQLKKFEQRPLISRAEAMNALDDIKPVLQWHRRYEQKQRVEALVYRLAYNGLQVKYIDAVTGELICMY